MNKNTVSSNINTNKWTMPTSKNTIIAILVTLLVLSVLGINILLFVGALLQTIVNLVRPIFDGILGIIFYYLGMAVNVSADVAGDVARTSIDIAEGTAHSVGNLLQNEDNVDGSIPEQTNLYKKIFDVTPANLAPSMEYDNEVQPSSSDTTTMGDTISAGVNVAELMMEEASVPLNVTIQDNSSKNDLDETIQTELKPNVISIEPSPSWCLVGQYGGKRSCISLDKNQICESGQKYTNQEDCLRLENANANKVVAKPNEQKSLSKPTYTQNWGIPPPVPPTAAMSPPMGQANCARSQYAINLQNPYYGSVKYKNIQGIPNVKYQGNKAGVYLQK